MDAFVVKIHKRVWSLKWKLLQEKAFDKLVIFHFASSLDVEPTVFVPYEAWSISQSEPKEILHNKGKEKRRGPAISNSEHQKKNKVKEIQRNIIWPKQW